MKLPPLLFIDDEITTTVIEGYIAELEKAFEVLTATRAEQVKPLLDRRTDIAALVVDMMLPVPDGVLSSRVDNGHSTGLWLVRSLRDLLISRQLGVFMLTNRSPTKDIAPVIAESPGDYPPPHLMAVRRKLDVPARAIVSAVRQMMDGIGRGPTVRPPARPNPPGRLPRGDEKNEGGVTEGEQGA